MGMFKIYVNKFKEINFDRLNLLASYIAKENNKSVSYVKFDMIRNFLKYKIGYTDYFKGDYINLANEKKKDFLTSKNYISVIKSGGSYKIIEEPKEELLDESEKSDIISNDAINLFGDIVEID